LVGRIEANGRYALDEQALHQLSRQRRSGSRQGKTGEAERLSYERKRERREQVASCRPPRTARKSKGHRSNRTSPVDLFVARQRAGEVTWRGALERALPCPDKYPSLIEQEPRIRPRRHIKLVWTAPCNGSLTYLFLLTAGEREFPVVAVRKIVVASASW